MKKIILIFLFYVFLFSQLVVAQDVEEQSEDESIKTHVGVKVLKNEIKPLDDRSPKLGWLNPEDITKSETFSFELEVKSPYPVKAIKVKVEGKEINLDELSSLKKETKQRANNSRGSNNGDDYEEVSIFAPLEKEKFILPLVLEDGENSIEIEVINTGGMVEDTVFQTSYEYRPVLHLVTIGVGKYLANHLGQAGAPRNLKYAAKDAKSIRDMFKDSKQKKLFSEVKHYHLVDEAATKNAIDRLIRQKLIGAVNNNDIVILFLAAHGEKRENEPLQFLPYDFDPDNKGLTGIDAYSIINPIEALECNTLLIFDACQSGMAVTNNNLVHRGPRRNPKTTRTNLVKENYSRNQCEKVILTASSDLAFEHEEWGHGALTKAILEILSGEADSRFLPDSKNALRGMSKKGKLVKTKKLMKSIVVDGMIDVHELLGYVDHRVPELVKEKKEEQMPVAEGNSDFLIFQLDK